MLRNLGEQQGTFFVRRKSLHYILVGINLCVHCGQDELDLVLSRVTVALVVRLAIVFACVVCDSLLIPTNLIALVVV